MCVEEYLHFPLISVQEVSDYRAAKKKKKKRKKLKKEIISFISLASDLKDGVQSPRLGYSA